MKRNILFAATIIAAVAGVVWAQNAIEENSGEVLIVAVGPTVDPALAEAVRSHLAVHGGCVAKVGPARADVPETPQVLVQELGADLSGEVIGVLALLAPGSEIRPADGILVSNKVAVLGLGALATGEGVATVENRPFVKRVLKQSMQAYGYLLGLKACLLPRCAMRVAGSEGSLDGKGINFCPPCHARSEALLKARRSPTGN